MHIDSHTKQQALNLLSDRTLVYPALVLCWSLVGLSHYSRPGRYCAGRR